jgi:hypothetical protein
MTRPAATDEVPRHRFGFVGYLRKKEALILSGRLGVLRDYEATWRDGDA